VSYIVLQKDIRKYEEIAVKFFRKLIPFAKLFNESARHVEIDDHFFFKGAPVAIVIVSKASINGALAASNMPLMAESHGLGVLYSGFFSIVLQYSRKLRKYFKLHHKDKVVITLVIGYPRVKYYRTTQKYKAKVLHL
ncbi:MAG: nitroreductase, partial [Coprobacillus sp.]